MRSQRSIPADSNYQNPHCGIDQTVQSAGTNTILLSFCQPVNPNQPITFHPLPVASNTTENPPFGDVSGWNHNPRLSFVDGTGIATFLDIHADYWYAPHHGRLRRSTNFKRQHVARLSQVVQQGQHQHRIGFFRRPRSESQSITFTQR